MLVISDLLLSIYHEARNSETNAFVRNSFASMQKTLRFDSAAIISLGFSQAGDMQIKGAFGYKLSLEEKLKVRMEMGITERHVQGRGIVGSDPHLAKCFRNKNRAHIVDSRTVPDASVVEYARRTCALHVLTMVTDDSGGSGFSALSLWRGGEHDRYELSDQKVADLLLPHFFMALSINKQMANTNVSQDNTYLPPIICNLNGLINFVEDAVFHFLQDQYPNWAPLYLPRVIIDGMNADASMIYVSKAFTAKGRVLNETLLVYISKKSESGSLTRNEYKIAQLLAQDATYKEIALQLGTSPATVRNQAHSIYKKLRISKKSSIRAALLLLEH